jgi:hypothetical protein
MWLVTLRAGRAGVLRLSSRRRERSECRSGDSRVRPSDTPLGEHDDAATWRMSGVSDAARDCHAAALRYSVSTSAGVFQPSVFRGRLFNVAATAAISWAE